MEKYRRLFWITLAAALNVVFFLIMLLWPSYEVSCIVNDIQVNEAPSPNQWESRPYYTVDVQVEAVGYATVPVTKFTMFFGHESDALHDAVDYYNQSRAYTCEVAVTWACIVDFGGISHDCLLYPVSYLLGLIVSMVLFVLCHHAYVEERRQHFNRDYAVVMNEITREEETSNT